MKSKMLATIMITPAAYEMAVRQLERCRDIDEYAHERQDVRVNPQRDARIDDEPERKHADPADEPGNCHRSECHAADAHAWRRGQEGAAV